MNSIRVRLLSSICLCLLMVFAVSGLLLYVYLRHVLESNFDAALFERADVFARTTEQQENGALEFEFLESNLAEYWPHPKAEYYEVWRQNGDVVGRSPSLAERDLLVSIPPRRSPSFQNTDLPDGRRGRVVVLNFVAHAADGAPPPVEQLTMALASSRTDLDKALSRVLKGLFLAGLALVVGAFPAVWWSVRRDLFSLQLLAEQANTIEADNLSFRFPTHSLPSELMPICRRLNGLLERLESAFNRERRFTADAAHELRTPIAELRTLAEVGIRDTSQSARDMREYFEDALDIARHLENLVTTLLALTRCEAGLQPVDMQAVDAASIIRDLWSDYARQAESLGLSASADLPDSAPITTDAGLLKAMLANLLSNAVSYTPQGGRIHLVVLSDKGSVALTLENTNHDLHSEDLHHLFEPFWRKQTERTSVQHCGVGLSLVAAYAKLLNIILKADITSEGLFQVTLRCSPSGSRPS